MRKRNKENIISKEKVFVQAEQNLEINRDNSPMRASEQASEYMKIEEHTMGLNIETYWNDER